MTEPALTVPPSHFWEVGALRQRHFASTDWPGATTSNSSAARSTCGYERSPRVSQCARASRRSLDRRSDVVAGHPSTRVFLHRSCTRIGSIGPILCSYLHRACVTARQWSRRTRGSDMELHDGGQEQLGGAEEENPTSPPPEPTMAPSNSPRPSVRLGRCPRRSTEDGPLSMSWSRSLS